MKIVLIVSLGTIFFFSISTPSQAQKKVKSFVVEKELNIPAEDVWAVVGVDYGAISNSHPTIVSSDYINGSTQACEGAERVCNFNEKGTRFLKEKMVKYDPENMTFVNQVVSAGKFPVDPEYTRAIYKVEPIDANRSKLSFDMQYRTKPAFIGGMVQGKFKRLINDYFIAIEHHIRYNQNIEKDGFKEIKNQYVSP